jgi:hypothetical protein
MTVAEGRLQVGLLLLQHCLFFAKPLHQPRVEHFRLGVQRMVLQEFARALEAGDAVLEFGLGYGDLRVDGSQLL